MTYINLDAIENNSPWLLGPNDRGFLSRVYAGGLEKYRKRLAQIGFDHQRHVLDAGCGFGQWSFAMAQDARHVTGIDISPSRISMCRKLARANRIPNVTFLTARLEEIPYADATFSAIFCYSAIYLTDYRRSFAEFRRVLEPRGWVYICTNGPGRYLYEIIHNPNSTSDFNIRRYAFKTFWNTLTGRWDGLSPQHGARVMTPRDTAARLEALGFEIVAVGGEAEIVRERGANNHRADPFHPAKYLGLDNVFEILVRKPLS